MDQHLTSVVWTIPIIFNTVPQINCLENSNLYTTRETYSNACDVKIMIYIISTHFPSRFSKRSRGWKSYENSYHKFWFWMGNKILGICKILSNKLLRCELWVDNVWFIRRCSLRLRVLLQLLLLRVCVLRVLGPSCEGSQSTPCTWGVPRGGVRVVR